MYELAYEQWIEITSRGTSGDQVHNILAAWRVERECLQAENTRLREQLEEIQDDRTARYGNQITAQVRIQKLKQENNHLQAENKCMRDTLGKFVDVNNWRRVPGMIYELYVGNLHPRSLAAKALKVGKMT